MYVVYGNEELNTGFSVLVGIVPSDYCLILKLFWRKQRCKTKVHPRSPRIRHFGHLHKMASIDYILFFFSWFLQAVPKNYYSVEQKMTSFGLRIWPVLLAKQFSVSSYTRKTVGLKRSYTTRSILRVYVINISFKIKIPFQL